MGRKNPKLKIDMAFLKKEIESAKTAIVSQSPLFAPYVHRFFPIYTWVVDTMATDGTRLFINPEFANELTWEQKIFVLIHEIMHCVLLHMMRIKSRNAIVYTSSGKPCSLFNIAGDYEINTIIVDTLNDFNEEFVKKLGGLYDIKYLNQPVEKIYDELKKNMPAAPPKKGGGKGGSTGGGGGAKEITVGSKVKIKATGEKGVVTAINPDGTYEIDPLNESFIPKLLKEGFTRAQIVPISDDDSEGEGEGEPSDQESEGKGENKGKGKGKGYKDLRTEEEKKGDVGGEEAKESGIFDEITGDPGATGAVIDSETGKRIAKASGYAENEIGPLEDPTDTWMVEGKKMLERAEKSNPRQSGKGKGNALINALYRIHKGDVDWKSLFKRFVATALSPEVEIKIGNKKHLGSDVLRYGEKAKYEALSSIVVCVDVSGSMGAKALQDILNEINQIIFSKRVNKVTIIFFDDGVDDKSVQTIKRMGKPYIPKNVSGGGGTSFQKPLDWIKEHLNDRVSLCVFFTDGGAANPKKPPYAHKFIWVVYDDPGYKQPFGRQVNLGQISKGE
jgi:predicted metal-dependent peptidase